MQTSKPNPTHMEEKSYRVKQFGQPTKRYCRTLNITDNPDLISKYRECHSRAGHWPEINEGIRQVGILEMEMYIYGNRVFMIVETPIDFDWDTAMQKLATLPRQQEWEAYVALLQGCDPDTPATEKWHMMERMFYLYD